MTVFQQVAHMLSAGCKVRFINAQIRQTKWPGTPSPLEIWFSELEKDTLDDYIVLPLENM